MALNLLAFVALTLLLLAFLMWRRYLYVARKADEEGPTKCPFSLTNEFGDRHLINAPHQAGSRWLTDVFSRSARRFPDLVALHIPHTGESLTFAELDQRANAVASALSSLVTGPDQVVTVAMSQDNWQIIACHLGILRAGGAVMFLDTSLPEKLVSHMLEDAQPVAILTRGKSRFRDLPTIDVCTLPDNAPRNRTPSWLDDPSQHLAAIFYTSGTTGLPKGVECTHAGYVNLALSYADYFDLAPGLDATTLTSSLGYDGSISEMYSAWVSGCSVVLLTPDEVRSGPDLLPLLREAEVTVLFCPPVLLTTLTSSPESDLPYPLCRYIVPAGEAFPQALVEPWTRGRRQVINTYGPTEASTDTSRQSLRPGEAITIGSPFPNVTYVILEVDSLVPLPHGEIGELCIGGIHVARGYRNLPDQTASQFVDHPQFGRLYRSGDKCRIDPETNRVFFLGRVDAQIKVRGHRVEIQPIEDMLQAQFEEIEAAVVDYQAEELIAFVRAPALFTGGEDRVVQAPASWASTILEALAGQLPQPAVPTRIFLVDTFSLKPVSGKIDRQTIPRLSQISSARLPTPPQEAARALPAPPDFAAEEIALNRQVLTICQEEVIPTLGWNDSFAESGGHSIIIARLVQRLRSEGWPVTVRDLLSDCNTAAKVAAKGAIRGNEPQDEDSPAEQIPTASHHDAGVRRDEKAARVLGFGWFTVFQLVFLLILYLPATVGLVTIVAISEIGEFFVTADLVDFSVLGLVMYALAWALPFANLLWVKICRLLLFNLHSRKLQPGVYPKWSRMHLRTWCIRRLELFVIRPLTTVIRSTRIFAWTLRRLGATVGRGLQCAHEVELLGPLGLLQIGDHVAIQTGASISTSRWVDNALHLGPVHLESGCKIGMRAGIANDVTVGQGSWITPLTSVLEDVGARQIWEGAPARATGEFAELRRTRNHRRNRLPTWLLETMNLAMQMVLEIALLVLPTALVAWLATTIIQVEDSPNGADYFSVTPIVEIVWQIGLYAFATSWTTILLISVLSCLFIRLTSFKPGIYPSGGLKCAMLLYRIKKLNQIQRLWTWTVSGQYLRALAGVRFKKVGASECDLMTNLVPELVTADSQVFWSHGCYTNVVDYGSYHVRLSHLDMPENFFASNNSVAEAGQLPTDFLLGVSTPASDIQFRRQLRTRRDRPRSIAGNPPLNFASESGGVKDAETELPGFFLFLTRFLLSDVLSISLLPVAEVLVYSLVYTILLRLGEPPVLSALAALVLTEGIVVVICIALKFILVGRKWGVDHSANFWSLRHFTYFFTQDCFFAWCAKSLRMLAGTALANIVLRRMGCRIGKRTLVSSPLQAFDWNAVSFGNDCVVEGMLQLHSFENMRLKVKRSELGDGCSINFGTMLMGGAVIEARTTVLPMSLVLKSMHLPSGIYRGSPVEPVDLKRGPG